jgi:hypothetical protein
MRSKQLQLIQRRVQGRLDPLFLNFRINFLKILNRCQVIAALSGIGNYNSGSVIKFY